MTRDTYRKGLMAELFAMAHLILRGYCILAWRYKTKVGEIDIIARRGRVIAFIEVKNRATPEAALYAITPAMRSRISRAARHFMQGLQGKAGAAALDFRFDLIAVSGFSVRHLDNAWMDTPY